MMTLSVLALAAAAFVQQTDTTFAVRAGTRLEVENMRGEVRITSWDRNTVRVRATHAARGGVEISERGAVLHVRSRAEHGMPTADIEVTVPRSLRVGVKGTFVSTRIDGVGGPVEVSTVHGDIDVRGASDVRVEAVQGSVRVENATGDVEARSVNEDVRVIGARGNVRAETINGKVQIEGSQSSNVRGAAVNGTVSYAGVIRDGGRYSFTSHSGDVVVAVPDGVNATVTLATIAGEFRSELPIQLTEARPGRRVTVTLGTGSAQLELESFSGRVRLTRAGR
jgi:DUF4097 and DUF4098 domain-containing protein YvlB